MRALFTWFAGIVMAGLLSICAGAQQQQQVADEFRPQPLPAYPAGGMDASIYPLGWSQEGDLGLIVRWVNEASDEERWSVIFWGSDLEEIEHNVLRVLLPPADPMEAFDAFWALHGETCLDMAARHDIELGEIRLLHFPYINARRNRMIEATLKVERGDSAQWGHQVVKRTTLTVTGSEPIVENFEFPQSILAIGLIGYFESPIPNRLMVLEGVVSMGFEGAPHPRSFRFVGVHAEATNFLSTAKGAEERGQKAFEQKDFQSAVASLEVASRSYQSRITNQRYREEVIPDDLSDALQRSLAMLDEARIHAAEQHRAEGRYEHARKLLTEVIVSANGQQVDQAWKKLVELSEATMYPAGTRIDGKKDQKGFEALVDYRRRLAEVPVGSVKYERLPLAEVLSALQSIAGEAGVEVAVEVPAPKKREQLLTLNFAESEDSVWDALETCANQAGLEVCFADERVQLVFPGEAFTRVFSVPDAFREGWQDPPPIKPDDPQRVRIMWGATDEISPAIIALLSDEQGFIVKPKWGSGYFVLSPDGKHLLVRHHCRRLKRIAVHLKKMGASP